MAGKRAGKLLRDAITQPKQGSNLQLLAAGNYLRTLGIDDDITVRRCLDVLTNPNSLFGGTKAGKKPINPYARKITVEEMQEVVDFMASTGFSPENIARLVVDFPQLLGYPVNERLRPLMEYLSGTLEMSSEQVVDLVVKRPCLLGLERQNVERIIGYLVNNGNSNDEILKLLESSL